MIRTRRARLPDRPQILDSVASDNLEVAGSVMASAQVKAAIWIGDEGCGAIAKTFKLLPGQLISAEIYYQTLRQPGLLGSTSCNSTGPMPQIAITAGSVPSALTPS